MRHLATSVCCSLLIAGCGRSDRARAAGTTGAAPAAATRSAGAAPAIALTDLAGKWNMRATPTTGRDTSPTVYVLTATGDTSGWALTPRNRKPIPVRVVAVAGDSVVIEAGPYESMRRKGVPVYVRTVLRMRGDSLVGTTTAHYATKRADSVLAVRVVGTRAP
ncbi:MAG: hypothetical protein ACJ79S_06715 [Gemmatimonadaceae bacterium]